MKSFATPTADAPACIGVHADRRSPPLKTSTLKIVLVADSASANFGGEAIHPIHYFRILRSRGIDAWLCVHERTRHELLKLFPDDAGHMLFVEDTWFEKFLWAIQKPLSRRLSYFTVQMLSRLNTQRRQRALIRRLVRERGIDVVHQPIPLAPKDPCLFYAMGAPVVIGPLNGGMTFPAAFAKRQSAAESVFVRVARAASDLAHWWMPGKRRAETILVANERTRRSLPGGLRGEVASLIDNCVDLATWKPGEPTTSDAAVTNRSTRFVYLGRLVDWKAVDLLLEAFAPVARRTDSRLEVIGDGDLRGALEAQARALGIADRVTFQGWRSQAECARELAASDALVLPSLYECGGAVVLEAMAVGLPIVATNWGGPADYVDAESGILVEPTTRAGFIDGLTAAMTKLADNPALRRQLGRGARQRVVDHFDWQQKVDDTLVIYEETVARARRTA